MLCTYTADLILKFRRINSVFINSIGLLEIIFSKVQKNSSVFAKKNASSTSTIPAKAKGG